MGFGQVVKSILQAKKVILKQLWQYHTEDDLVSHVALNSNDGLKIIIGTKQGNVIQLNDQGKVDWIFKCSPKSEKEDLFIDQETKNSISAPPTLFEIGRKKHIIIGTESADIFCIDLEGNLKWQTKASGGLRAAPLIRDVDKDGELEIIFGCTDNKINIFSSEGKIKSRIDLGEPIEATPIFIKDNLIVGTAEGKVFSFTPKGKLNWKFNTKDKITATILPVELSNDTTWHLLVGSHDNTLYTLTLDGEVTWHYQTQGAIISQPITAHITNDREKDIVFGSSDNKIYCLTARGELRWTFETDFWVISKIALIKTEQPKIVAGSYDQHLYVLDAQGNESLNYLPGISGIVNQPGYSSIGQSQEVVESSGKKIHEQQVDGNIIGCEQIPETNKLVVNTRQGNIYLFELTEE